MGATAPGPSLAILLKKMAYTEVAQVKKRAKRALNHSDAGKQAEIDAAITEGIEWGESRINVRLAARYPVPFVDGSVPVPIQHICADFAAYFALREVYSGGADNESPTLAREILAEAYKELEALAEGDAQLVDDLQDDQVGVIANQGTPGPLASFDLVNKTVEDTFPFAPYKRCF